MGYLMQKSIICILILLPCFSFSQKQGSIWCFGDSAMVNFSDTSNIVAGTSNVKSRGSCVSISDSSGQLLFYAFTRAGVAGKTTLVYNSNHQQMQNGDSIVGQGWYHELVIIPYPGSDSLFYLFSVGVTFYDGIYYSVIDISQNGGLGNVTLKNVPLLQTFQVVDCLTAIKHGNGRDWWILFRRWNGSPSAPNTEFHYYLVSPAGVTNYSIQNIGSIQSSGFGGFTWSGNGNRFAYYNPQGLLELYDFDRCTGVISNPVTIHVENTQAPYETYWGAAFSPSDSLLYVTKIPLAASDTSRLYQFDLASSNIATSSDTLWETLFISQMGHLKLSPDGKIYQTNNYYGGFPYPDTIYNNINTNLSVINSPDNLGASCNLQPYSFYLGGKRTYFGLPNNPNYFLGPKIGSVCDSLTEISESAQTVVISNLFPNPNKGKFTVNYFLQNGKSGTLEIFNMKGQNVFKELLQRYTYLKEINIKSLPEGIYLLKISSGSNNITKKFVIQ